MTYNRSEVTSTGYDARTGRNQDGAGKPRADPPEVVVILPTLNEVANLRRTLESIPLADLKARGWRVTPIVIDGGSTDGTVDGGAQARATRAPTTGQGEGPRHPRGAPLLAERGDAVRDRDRRRLYVPGRGGPFVALTARLGLGPGRRGPAELPGSRRAPKSSFTASVTRYLPTWRASWVGI